MFDADTFMNLIGWSRYIDALLNSANGGEDWSLHLAEQLRSCRYARAA